MDQNAADCDRIEFLTNLISNLNSNSGASKCSPKDSLEDTPKAHRVSKSTSSPDASVDEKLKRHMLCLMETEAYKSHLQDRKELPIYQEKETILGTLRNALGNVIVVSGLTGSGKSTQIPQIILQEELLAGRGSTTNIICTQPRRISATSIASRVSEELGEGTETGGLVGYQIRMESSTSDLTRLLFCTTGILLKRLESDPDLTGVNFVIMDEVHERNLDSDFLLIVMKRLMQRRSNIKLILMSATMDAEKFAEYFECPVIKVGGRLFDVKSYFLEDMIEMTSYILDEQSEYAKRMIGDTSKKSSNVKIHVSHFFL